MPPARTTKKKARELKKKAKVNKPDLTFNCIEIRQGAYKLYCFVSDAKTLWNIVEINQRDPDKDEGYQRALSASRVSAIKKFIDKNNAIPLSILIALGDGSKYDNEKKMLTIPNKPDAGWVIDGQHRLAGAHEAETEIEFAVIAILSANEREQIKQFITINQEAKGVPKSLYYDLLKHLPPDKSEADLSKERAVDIANELKKDEFSPFLNRIVITPPKSGEISLNNFVRKVSPLIGKNGFFKSYTITEQIKILNNYFVAFKNHFPQFFEYENPVFYKTIGFGALVNALPTIFQLTLKYHKGFTTNDIVKIVDNIADFDFNEWNELGTGVAAEKQASDDLTATLMKRLEDETGEEVSQLRL
jgi:DGQHR domain-containing protein